MTVYYISDMSEDFITQQVAEFRRRYPRAESVPVKAKSVPEPGRNIVKLESYFEVGDKQGRLHIHGVLKLAHTGNYQMDRAKISGVVAGVLGHKVHLNIVGSGMTATLTPGTLYDTAVLCSPVSLLGNSNCRTSIFWRADNRSFSATRRS